MNTLPTTLFCLDRIFSISDEIIANPSIDDVLHSVVQVAVELVGCERAGVYLSGESSGQLRLIALSNHTEHVFDLQVPVDQSIAGAAFNCNDPVIVQDIQQDPHNHPAVDELLNVTCRSLMAVPLAFRARKIGVIEVINKQQGQFDEDDLKVMVALAAQATIAIETARVYRQAQEEIAERIQVEEELLRYKEHLEELVKERTAEVHHLAIIDTLTGLFNSRHIMILGNKALQHALRYHGPLSIMMVDLDHFQKTNELYGHTVGDDALRKLADILRQNLRSADIIGRSGGDEFVVLMPHTKLHSAHKLAERLLSQIRETRLDTPQGQFGLTASIGVVEMSHVLPQTLDALINRSNQALNTAKQAGRDQVCVGRE